jgi:beta-galactosidase
MGNRVLVPQDSKLAWGSYSCNLWCDLINLEGAEALATFEDDFYAGRPAITEHRFGRGRALYVATCPEPALIANLMGMLLDDLGIAPPLEAPQGVEVTRREAVGHERSGGYTFVLNHNTVAAHVSLPAPMRDILTGKTHEHSLMLPPLEVAILERRTAHGSSATGPDRA